LETDTDGDGIPDSVELIFPPIDVDVSDIIKHHFGFVIPELI